MLRNLLSLLFVMVLASLAVPGMQRVSAAAQTPTGHLLAVDVNASDVSNVRVGDSVRTQSDSFVRVENCTAQIGESSANSRASCNPTQPCGLCNMCHACHQVALADAMAEPFISAALNVPSQYLATSYLSAERTPSFKPPIL